MIFNEWYANLQDFMEKDQDKLTEQSAFKLNEIIHFVDQYSITNLEEILFIEKEKAMSQSKKVKIL